MRTLFTTGWKVAGLAGERGKVLGWFLPRTLHCQGPEVEKLAPGFESDQVIKGFPKLCMIRA